MDKPLICPLRFAGKSEVREELHECIKERCAWWSDSGETPCCAVKDIPMWLASIQLDGLPARSN